MIVCPSLFFLLRNFEFLVKLYRCFLFIVTVNGIFTHICVMRNCFNGQGSETTAFLPDSGLSYYNLKPPQVPKNRFIGLYLMPRAHKVSGKTGCHNNGGWTFVSQVVCFLITRITLQGPRFSQDSTGKSGTCAK